MAGFLFVLGHSYMYELTYMKGTCMNKKKPRALNSRDIELATWIAEQGAVRLSTIGKKLSRETHLDPRQLRRIGERLVAKNLAFKENILTGSAILWPTTKALALAEFSGSDILRNKRPALSNLLHSIEVAEVRLVYEFNGATWICERKIREQFLEHLPDGIAYYEDTQIIVEVDRTRKNKVRFREILNSNLNSFGKNIVVDYWTTNDLFIFVSNQCDLLPKEVRSRVRIFIIPEEAL